MIAFRRILGWFKTHLILSLGVLVAIAGAGLSFRTWIIRSEGNISEPLARGAIVQSVYGIGTVTVTHSYQIKPGVIDHIAEIYVREGDYVKKGQRLLRMENINWTAPFSGTVTYLPFKVGEIVFPQTVVLTMVDLADRYLVVSLEQQGALQVRRKQRVRVSFDTIREQNYVGEVESVYSNDNNFLARIEVANLPEHILPGMTADVAIEILTKPDVLLVPVAALDRGHVWVKRGRGIPQQVEVSTGIVDRDEAEVESGDLRAGDRVIIHKSLTP